MSTLDPHVPEPGYMKRWAGQAFSLMTRSPLALVVFCVGTLVAGFVSLFPLLLIVSLNMPTFATMGALYTLPILPMIPVMFFVTALLFHADTGTGPSMGAAWQGARGLFVPVLVLMLALNVFMALIFGASPNDVETAAGTTDTVAVQDVLLQSSLIMGGNGVSGFIVFCIWASLIIVPFMLGMGADYQQAKIFEKKLHTKAPRVRNNLFLVAMAGILLTMTHPVIWIPVLYFIQAFLYVAARELISGTKENGKQTVDSLNTVSSPT